MGALDGLLMLSLEQAVAAPYGSCRLADAGAGVIKVGRLEGEVAPGTTRPRAGCPAISCG